MPSKATSYERVKAKQHRAKRVGGPSSPDYTRGKKTGEVKNRKSPVTGPELLRLAKRGIDEIDSKGGFTGPAIGAARKLGVKLFSRGKKV